MKKLFFIVFLLPVLVFANGYGIATLVKGSVQVLKADGKNIILKRGNKVFESDTIITSSKSIVRVVMIDTNIIDVYPNSKVLIKQYVYSPQEDNKNVKLEVSVGQIKSTVKQKYDNEKNKYNVKTPAIVAGVRGTIFTTEHELKTGASRVFTHEGNVLVGRIDAQENVKEFFSVKANQKIQIDSNIQKPQVLDVPKIEIQKQQAIDKQDGFVKVERNSTKNRLDTSRPSGSFIPPGSANLGDGSPNMGEPPRSDSSRPDTDSRDEGSSEVNEPSRSEVGSRPAEDSPIKREDSEPIKREDALPIKLPDRESSRPDSQDGDKEIKKRLQEEFKRSKHSRKEG